MDMRMPNALAAVFSNRARAAACADDLERRGFARPWIAVTHPAPAAPPAAPKAERASRNEIAETSDGALGAIGRFFTGEGNSLRRSLEDHGLDPDAAQALDEALPAPATVLVVDARERESEALESVRRYGGAATPPPVGQPALEAETPWDDEPWDEGSAVEALEREEDAFYARRPPGP